MLSVTEKQGTFISLFIQKLISGTQAEKKIMSDTNILLLRSFLIF